MLSDAFVLSTYARQPVAFVKGRGSIVWDAEGKEYIDMLAGVAVDNLGHSHPKITRVLCDQVKKISHTSNIFLNDWQAKLAQKLIELSGLDKAFFCNSGTEAIEASIKFARHYAHEEGFTNKWEIITFNNSFHGRTFGSISATGQPKYQQGFGPLLPGFKTIVYNDINVLKAAISSQTLAIMIEPIQGEGGVNIPDADYLKNVAKLCKEQGLLLILDEVQTGISRTGSFLSFLRAGIKPDIVALAKGLGSGFPIGACLVSKRIANHVKPGLHASTFGGNQLASRVAFETVKIASAKSFLKSVAEKGGYLVDELKKLKLDSGLIKEVRGVGLMIGCELTQPVGSQIVASALKRGLIVNSLHDTVIRFVPPLIISKREIKLAVKLFAEVLKEFDS